MAISALCFPIPSWQHSLFPALVPSFIQHSFSAQPWNVTTSSILSCHLSHRRKRWKKVTQNNCQPKYCPNIPTLRYTDDLGYHCLLPVLLTLMPGAHETAASSSWERPLMPLSKHCTEIPSLDFLGIPPPSERQRVPSLEKGKRIT